MLFKNLCILMLWMEVASALEGLMTLEIVNFSMEVLRLCVDNIKQIA